LNPSHPNTTGASARDYTSLSPTYGGIRAIEAGRLAYLLELTLEENGIKV
jgi:hypothetical protein